MWFDIICIVIALAGIFSGFRRGFFSQAGAVLGVILGIVGCNVFADSLVSLFHGPVADAASLMLANILAYVIVFVVGYLIGRLVGTFFSKSLAALKLGFMNRVAGAVFTTLEYTLVFSLLLNAWIGVFPNTRLASEHDGIKSFVLDFGPDILGSPTVSEIFHSVQDTVTKTSEHIKTL